MALRVIGPALLLFATAVAPLTRQVALPASNASPAKAAATAGTIERLRARVIARYPHDPRAFTQGLLWHDGYLYESTGKLGVSEVRRVRLSDGAVLARRSIPADQFGEGLALAGSTLVSLTWHQGIAYRWDVAALTPRSRLHYPGEGWGLAHDGQSLILSDGTASLRFLNPENLAEHRRVTITANDWPLLHLNELEMMDGQLWGNVWQRDYIVRIDPATGRVNALVDLKPLRAELKLVDPDAVLNGIAWDAANRRMFVTGKYWPTLFEIALY